MSVHYLKTCGCLVVIEADGTTHHRKMSEELATQWQWFLAYAG